MTNGSGLRILIAGSGRLGYSTMMPLLESRHEVVGLVQNARNVPRWKRPMLPWQYRFTSMNPSPLHEAASRGLPVCWLDKMDEAELAPLQALKPDIIITCGFSIILSEAVLSLPRIGCINVHTALLPKHRGATPCAHVVLEGESESGVSIHASEKGIDTGAIIAQKSFPVLSDHNSMDVYLSSCACAESIILDAVNKVAEHGFSCAAPQVLEDGQYDPRFDDDWAKIDWRKPAEELERLVRAAYIYVPAFFEFRGERVNVPEATFTTEEHQAYPGSVLRTRPHLEIATGSGTLIVHNTYTASFGGRVWPRLTTRLKAGMALD